MKQVSDSIRVRFRDLDALGHVNYAVYLTYMEEALTRLWEVVLGYTDREVDARDFGCVTVRVEVDYRNAVVYGDTVETAIWVSRIGRSSFITDYRLSEGRSSKLIAEGKTVQVVTFKDTEGKSMAEDIRSALAEYMPASAQEPSEGAAT